MSRRERALSPTPASPNKDSIPCQDRCVGLRWMDTMASLGAMEGKESRVEPSRTSDHTATHNIRILPHCQTARQDRRAVCLLVSGMFSDSMRSGYGLGFGLWLLGRPPCWGRGLRGRSPNDFVGWGNLL